MRVLIDKVELLKDYKCGEGMSNIELAKKYGVTPPTIRNYLIRMGMYVPQRKIRKPISKKPICINGISSNLCSSIKGKDCECMIWEKNQKK